MRVIAGDFKGRKLIAPNGLDVRPTGDKIKGAVFNMIVDRIVDASVIDLFAGSGNLGIEALSRGAKSCIFFDNSRESIIAINDNLKHISGGKSGDRALRSSVVEQADFRIALRKHNCADADVVFFDPPYNSGYYKETMQLLDRYDIIIPGGILVMESANDISLGEEIYDFSLIKERSYGKTKITIYERNQK